MKVTSSSMEVDIKVLTEALSDLHTKQYKRHAHFNNFMSNLQNVEM